jgi:pimeloyl-ACP methyl ester carboxylesterase
MDNQLKQYQHANGLTIQELGSGPRIVFVHGGGVGGSSAWQAQHGWGDRFQLVMPFRAAYGPHPITTREDFEQDALLVADLLFEGAHLVGHSYGGVVALLAAAARPAAVRSLTLIEPGATSVARGFTFVDAFETRLAVLASDPPADPDAHLRALTSILDPSGELPRPLSAPLQAFADRLHLLRGTNDAVIPLETLRAASIPALVVSGGHSRVFDTIALILSEELPAELAIFPGDGHMPHWHSEAANQRICSFLDTVDGTAWSATQREPLTRLDAVSSSG